jgi:PAS domain S-box-containing protein
MHEVAGYERTENFDYGRVNRELHHPDDLERVTKWLGECVASGERTITPNEYRIVRKDGEVVWVHVEGVVERDEAGAPIVFATVQDITELKEAQQAIAELNAELEQRVIDRTAALEAVNAELESMTYSVSHDLRAPVRHIAGFSDLLQKNIGADLDERQRHYLERISASVGQMGDLIDDLLEFSRTGRVELEIEDVDMGAAVEAARETVRPHDGDREIEWVVGELPSVRGDERLLQLVLTNLLDNAVKFTRPCERARIEVAASRGDGEIVYSVSDNGVGFDPRYAGKMFGVFQRMHPADEFEGTGVGLANVRRAIARLGGRTWAEGEIDDGATFYFSVPVRKES